MTSGGKPLTVPPGNLKEAIDWVLCMSGTDVAGGSGKGKQAIKKLAEKVISLLTTTVVSGGRYGYVHGVSVGSLLGGDFSGSGHSGNCRPIESLCNGLRELIGYGSGILNGNGIVSQSYQSSYSDQPPSSSVDSEEVAKFFLGFIPLTFFALGFLYWQCKGGWAGKDLSDGPMKAFLVEMGFTAEQLNEEKKGSDVSGMFSGFDEFRRVDPISPTFPAFLQKVEEEGKKKFKSTPSHVPIYTHCLIALTYISKTSDALSTDKIPQAKEEITNMLSELSEAVKSLGISGLEKLSKAYTNLNTAITDAMKSTESTSSVGGAAAGTLSTLGLGGGAAAAYLFNLGGVKTLVNGLLKIG
ncbi:variant erythrocyte surface antigen-1 family protein [Babesia caballi]|uniref:Variant erythrocyte surface antigen-1 family protein n=1 Tax=Babesia caballi TaxID=5871 RepID=A0AAV4LY70_BABCB|nr:variant erythrocyte surface antigen-1 family protein [Babesia caballi]